MIKNASQPAQVFYGLHFQPGTAEYVNEEGKAYKILINQDAINKMNKTYAGKVLYVDHVDEVDLTKFEREAAGLVVESFFNKSDGNTWAKFLCFSDAGLACIKKGWVLSNSYKPTVKGPGGRWHGMEYEAEFLDGTFDHLALVPNPRYEASVIYTPEEFKEYNEKKEAELLKVANSMNKTKKEITKMGKFNFFKKETVDNSAELESSMVTIGGKDMSIRNALELAEKFQNMHGYASDEHLVKVNDDEEMSVGELRDCYSSMKKKNDEAEEEKKKNSEEEKKKNSEAEEEKKKNAEKEEEEKKKNEAKAKEEEEMKKNSSHFNTLFNAAQKFDEDKTKTVILNSDRVALGKKLF